MTLATTLFDLTGKVALVTGGNGGIGRGIALGLAGAGAAVVVAARDEQKTAAVVVEIEALGVDALGVRCDVLVRADIDAAIDAVRQRFGRLDILVNNAGIARRGSPQDLSEDDWDAVLGTNLKSTFLFSQAAYPLLKERGGKVINIGSMTSIFGSARVPSYSASKGAVAQLTKSTAIAWADDNIQVNAIFPGWITTDMTQPLRDTDIYDEIVQRTPQKRFAEPEELQGAALLLASSASGFITGQAIVVDGGYSIA